MKTFAKFLLVVSVQLLVLSVHMILIDGEKINEDSAISDQESGGNSTSGGGGGEEVTAVEYNVSIINKRGPDGSIRPEGKICRWTKQCWGLRIRGGTACEKDLGSGWISGWRSKRGNCPLARRRIQCCVVM